MENKDSLEGMVAILRSDLPAPALRLWDAMVEQTIAPEYADQYEEAVLHAQLIGGMCSSQIAVSIDTEELGILVDSLRAFSNLRDRECIWSTNYQRLELRLTVQMETWEPPVECDVWLRDAINAQEEHHCRFITNLTWVAAFLAEVERMTLRYRRARVCLGEG